MATVKAAMTTTAAESSAVAATTKTAAAAMATVTASDKGNGNGDGDGGGVSIHNLRTVAPRFGELLAQLVYLTWLLHVGPGFQTCLVPLSFG